MINNIGSWASIIGLLISIITLIISYNVKSKVNKLQQSNLFDKRINKHLSNIDLLQNKLHLLIFEKEINDIEIKKIIVELLTEFESILPKLSSKHFQNEVVHLMKKLNNIKSKDIYYLDKEKNRLSDNFKIYLKSIFNNKIPIKTVQNTYILINENYNRIQKVKLDKKAEIK